MMMMDCYYFQQQAVVVVWQGLQLEEVDEMQRRMPAAVVADFAVVVDIDSAAAVVDDVDTFGE